MLHRLKLLVLGRIVTRQRTAERYFPLIDSGLPNERGVQKIERILPSRGSGSKRLSGESTRRRRRELNPFSAPVALGIASPSRAITKWVPSVLLWLVRSSFSAFTRR